MRFADSVLTGPTSRGLLHRPEPVGKPTQARIGHQGWRSGVRAGLASAIPRQSVNARRRGVSIHATPEKPLRAGAAENRHPVTCGIVNCRVRITVKVVYKLRIDIASRA